MAIMTRARKTVALLAIGFLGAACGTSTEKPAGTGAPLPAAPTTTDPRTFTGDVSAFYATPDPVAGQVHGTLLRFKEIPLANGGLTGAKAYRILYRSLSVNADAPIVVSGFVVVPTAESKTARPMVAWAHGTVGMADSCAPSKSFDGKAANATDNVQTTLFSQMQAFINKGYVIVATDYEGLGTAGPHPFLVGNSEGRSVLDSLIATRQLTAANASETAVIYGLSQGGQAALFAGELAPTWAPDIKVAGVVAAAPFSEVDLLLPVAATVPDVSQYYVMGVYGQVDANPKLKVSDVLDPAAIAQAGTIETQCLDQLAVTFRSLLTSSGKSTFMVKNPLDLPDWKAQLTSIVPGQRPTGAPILIIQGANDTTVPAFTTKALVDRECKQDRVQYNVYPATGHGDSIVSGSGAILSFVTDRFTGAAFKSTCGS